MADGGGLVDGKEVKAAYEQAAEGEAVEVFDGLPLIEEATALKEKGNGHVKQKQFGEATKCYEEGLAVLGKSQGYPMLREEQERVSALRAVLHSNVAQCMLSQKLYRRAVDAATECLEIDEGNAKALHRRSQAHEALREYQDALKDALALKKLGGGGLDVDKLEKRCEELLLAMTSENKAVNQVAKKNEDMFEMKKRFEAVFEKYDLEGTDAAPEVAKWLVSDDNFAQTVEKVAKRWRMTKQHAEDFAKWISKGLELKIIPRPQVDA
mmetsp:Transcript_40323/g.128139  ORF Transcript_40323/g.128139 Transcript_40323/m.128139 type:complete len:267 (-) Transcript_40323:202-1002(-)